MTVGSDVSSVVNGALLLYVTTALLAGVAECLTLSLILLFLLCRYNNNNNMVTLTLRYFAPIFNNDLEIQKQRRQPECLLQRHHQGYQRLNRR
jgi:hypothetical protein